MTARSKFLTKERSSGAPTPDAHESERPVPDFLANQKLDTGPDPVRKTVSTRDFRKIGARPPLGEYIKQLWGRRHFIREESSAKAFGTIKNTLLGRAWLVLEPFLSAGIYYLIFSVLLKFDRGVENFVAYLVIGVTFFGYLNKHLGGGASVIQSGRSLIRAFSFPRASLVFSYNLRQTIDFLPSVVAVVIFIVVVPPHALPTWTWLLTPLALLLAVPFALGLTFITATLTTMFADLKFIWPLLTRFWFYASGIFWHVNMFAENSIGQTVMKANPGWVFLELCRETLAYGRIPPLSMWLYFAAWAFGTFIVGFLLFWSQEERFGQDDN